MKTTILIISDDKTLLKLIQQMNEEYHFHFSITYCHDYQQSKNREQANIIFIDFDGYVCEEQGEIIKQFKLVRHLALIVFKTTYVEDEYRTLFKSGVFDCLKKPIDQESLYFLFHELLKKQNEKDVPSEDISLKKLRTDLKVGLAYDLIFGNIKNSKEIWERSNRAGLPVVPNTAMVVHIDNFLKITQNKSKMWEQRIRCEVTSCIQHFLDEKIAETLIIITATDKITVVLSIPLQMNQMAYKKIATKYAEEIKAYVKMKTGYTVTIGIGNYYEDARNLHVSYQEALHAQSYKLFFEEDVVIHIDDLEPYPSDKGMLPKNDILLLANKLTIGDFSGVQRSLDIILQTLLIPSKIDPQAFKLQILDLIGTLARSAIEGGANPKKIFSSHLQFAQDLNRIESLRQIKEWFKTVTEYFLEQVLQNHNEQIVQIIQKAIQYIDKNYNKKISLEQVADYIHLSPNYFSNLFKKTTGFSFVEYLTQFRIEKAKAMLMDLDLTIYQIAKEIGYNDTRYFSRVFKSLVGKTPTQYRNSMLVTKVSNLKTSKE